MFAFSLHTTSAFTPNCVKYQISVLNANFHIIYRAAKPEFIVVCETGIYFCRL